MNMYTIDDLKEIIKEELEKKEYMQEPYSLFEPIQYILEDGGKRLRPMLTLMAYNLYREDIEKVLKSAIGIEIFHNYTLLHDDVMDDAELRRGRPTVHKKWNRNVAILSGDAAAITAYQCIEHCEDKYLRRAIDFFNQVAMDVCKGQQYDMVFETRNDVTEEEYIHMIYLKTSVLLAGSLRHGALLAASNMNIMLCMISGEIWDWHSSCRMIIWTCMVMWQSSGKISVEILSRIRKRIC